MPSKTLECSHATGAHDEPCDLVAGLERELAEARRCLRTVRCEVCRHDYEDDPNAQPICYLADHIEAYEAIFGKKGPC